MIGLAPLGRPPVLAARRAIFDRAPGGMLIAVAGVLDQFLLGLLKSLGLPLPGLDQRAIGLPAVAFARDRFRAGPTADRRGLGRGSVGFLQSTIWSGHRLLSTPGGRRQTPCTGSIGEGRIQGARSVA